MAVPTRTDITLAGSANAGQPARLVLTSATDWAWPADLGTDCLNCYIEHNGTRIKHWFEDTRRARASVWLNSPNPIVAGDTLTLVSGVSRPRRKPRPKDVGLLAGVNFSDFRQLQNRRPYQTFLATAEYEGVTAAYQHNTSFYRNSLTGELVLFWEFGADTNELKGLKYISRARSVDNGRTFSAGQIDLYLDGTPPTNITDEDHQIPGPAWTRADGKTVHVFAAHHNVNFEGGAMYTAVSTGDALDGGNDWATPTEITGSDNYITGSDPHVLSNGEWAFGAQRSVGGSRFYYSANEGATWGYGVVGGVNATKTNEIAVWEDPTTKGHIIALGRVATTNYSAFYLESHSYDYGRTWSDYVDSEHHSVQTKPNAIVHSSGLVLLATNDHQSVRNTKSGGTRRRLIVKISADGGRTWDRQLVVQDRMWDAYAYPTLVEVDGGDVLVAYSVNKANLEIMRLTRGEILNSDHPVGYGMEGGFTRPEGGYRFTRRKSGIQFSPLIFEPPHTFPLVISITVQGQALHQGQAHLINVNRQNTTTHYQESFVQLRRTWNDFEARYAESVGTSNYTKIGDLTSSAATIDLEFVEGWKFKVRLNGTYVEFATDDEPIDEATPYNNNQALGAFWPYYFAIGPWESQSALDLTYWLQYYSAAVAHDPAFLTGALD